MRAPFALALILTMLPCAAPLAAEPAQSTTTIGPASPLLAEGAEALEAGRMQEGVRKTLAGLEGPNSTADTAAGHSNLCAGYAALKRWDEALVHCNTALQLDAGNWRTYSNRAAVYIGKGLYDLALTDVETGLGIEPGSRTLRTVLRIVQEHKRAHEERTRSSVQS